MSTMFEIRVRNLWDLKRIPEPEARKIVTRQIAETERKNAARKATIHERYAFWGGLPKRK